MLLVNIYSWYTKDQDTILSSRDFHLTFLPKGECNDQFINHLNTHNDLFERATMPWSSGNSCLPEPLQFRIILDFLSHNLWFNPPPLFLPAIDVHQ